MQHRLNGAHLIDGRWQATGRQTFCAVNPADATPLEPVFHGATPGEIDAASRAARNAFDRTRELDQRWPADLLDRMADRIMDLGDALLDRAGAETALPRQRLLGERTRTCNQLKLFAELVRDGSWVDAVIDHADPNRQPIPKPDVRRMLRPLGVIAVFDASNFPLAFGACGGDTASALAAGNAVVLKAHPTHPGTDELCADATLAALSELKLPTGLFNLIQGNSNDSGAALVKHDLIDAVGFTGSLRGGRALFDLAAQRPRPIPLFAEMGSLNPLIVLTGAIAHRSDAIAKGLANSITMGCGQFCTKPGVVFIPRGDQADRFVSSLLEQLRAIPAAPMLNRPLHQNFSATIEQFEKIPGVIRLLDGQASGHASVSPSLLQTDVETWRKQSELHAEAFGPAALIVRFADPDDLRRALDTIEGSLTAAVHVGEKDDTKDVAQLLDDLSRLAGRVILNGYPTGVEVCHAMVHGGPYPATTAPGSTSVGTASIRRFTRPVAWQDVADDLLPPALRDVNPLGIRRMVDGKFRPSGD